MQNGSSEDGRIVNRATIALSQQKSKLLLIEDSETFLQLITRALESQYEIGSLKSADDGLAVCRAFEPDIILLDIGLSGTLSGLDFLELLKAEPQFDSLPVLLISANAATDIISHGLALGANDYLVKPFQIRHLELKIKNLLLLCNRVELKSLNKQLIPVKIKKTNEKRIVEQLNKLADAAIIEKRELHMLEVTQKLHVSQSTLGRLIKREFNVTTNNYLMLRKMEKAKLLLTNVPKMPIKEVADLLGFNSVSYFSKCFKRHFNTTPSDIAGRT